ncbi:hypothetical protein ACU1JV_00645 [Paenibacillus sp. T2-29]
MKNLIGTWIYNTGSGENWDCPNDGFATIEEAIEEGKRYFTDLNRKHDLLVGSFDVGQRSDSFVNICGSKIIDQAQEDSYERAGELSDYWLYKVSSENEDLLSDMMTKTFRKWLKITNNEPKFHSIDAIKTIKMEG